MRVRVRVRDRKYVPVYVCYACMGMCMLVCVFASVCDAVCLAMCSNKQIVNSDSELRLQTPIGILSSSKRKIYYDTIVVEITLQN